MKEALKKNYKDEEEQLMVVVLVESSEIFI
jgi:hypothetical protein